MRNGLILAGWLVFTAGAYWVFEGRYLLPVKAIHAVETPSTPKGAVTMTLAWGADCACSGDEVDHLHTLESKFGPRGYQLHVLIPCLAKDAAAALEAWKKTGIAAEATADIKGVKCLRLGLTATPAALVQNKDGQVVYRGSLHAGRFCHNEDLAYASQAIAAALDGQQPKIKQVPFYGCAIGFGS